MEYQISTSKGNQSTALVKVDDIPDAALVEDDEPNWSPKDIALDDHKILQHGNDPNDVSAQR